VGGLVVVIIVVFVVCQTPAFVNQLLFSLIGADDYQCGKVGDSKCSKSPSEQQQQQQQ